MRIRQPIRIRLQATAEILKKELAEKGAIDVGTGVERQLGVSTGVLQEALFILETEGYNRYGVGVPQAKRPEETHLSLPLFPFLRSTRERFIRTLIW